MTHIFISLGDYTPCRGATQLSGISTSAEILGAASARGDRYQVSYCPSQLHYGQVPEKIGVFNLHSFWLYGKKISLAIESEIQSSRTTQIKS